MLYLKNAITIVEIVIGAAAVMLLSNYLGYETGRWTGIYCWTCRLIKRCGIRDTRRGSALLIREQSAFQ
jgi:hypothetical protein